MPAQNGPSSNNLSVDYATMREAAAAFAGAGDLFAAPAGTAIAQLQGSTAAPVSSELHAVAAQLWAHTQNLLDTCNGLGRGLNAAADSYSAADRNVGQSWSQRAE